MPIWKKIHIEYYNKWILQERNIHTYARTRVKGDFIIFKIQYARCKYTLKEGKTIIKFFRVPLRVDGSPEIEIKDNEKYLTDNAYSFFKGLYKNEIEELMYYVCNDEINELIYNQEQTIKKLKNDIASLNKDLQEQIRLNKRGPLKRFKDWFKKIFT